MLSRQRLISKRITFDAPPKSGKSKNPNRKSSTKFATYKICFKLSFKQNNVFFSRTKTECISWILLDIYFDIGRTDQRAGTMSTELRRADFCCFISNRNNVNHVKECFSPKAAYKPAIWIGDGEAAELCWMRAISNGTCTVYMVSAQCERCKLLSVIPIRMCLTMKS